MTDGTEAGTRLVRDVLPGPESGYAGGGRALGDLYLFPGSGGDGGRTLWRSDGTRTGTFSLGVVLPWYGWALTGLGDELFFAAGPAWEERELRKSNGRKHGDARVAPIAPAAATVYTAVAANGLLYLAGAEEDHGEELWVTDGTPEGTALVRDVTPGSGSSRPRGFFTAGGLVLFRASDPAHGTELWASDGTAAGTRLVGDIHPGPAWVSTSDSPGAACGDRVMFPASDGQSGVELWAWRLR